MKYIIHQALTAFFIAGFLTAGYAQQDWKTMMLDDNAKFHDIQSAYQNDIQGKSYQKGHGWKQFLRWENFWEDRLMPDGSFPDVYKNYKANWDGLTQRSIENGNWVPLGPFDHTNTSSWSSGTGRVNVICEDPNNAEVIYVGAPSGGLWKSSDAGQSWLPMCDQLASIGISDIAIDYTNSDIIYLGTGDRDGGHTYSIGVVKSIDGGETWSMIGPDMGKINYVLMHPSDPEKIYVAASTGLYFSDDSGETWINKFDKNIGDLKINPANADVLYISASNRFFKSIDGGDNFVEPLGIPGNAGRIAIGVTPANPAVVYLLMAKQDNSFYGIYKSEDTGNSFALKHNETDIFDGSRQAFYDMAIAVSRTDENVIVTGVLNLWKSENGGTEMIRLNNWSSPNTVSYTHADIHFLKFVGDQLYCGSDGGIYRSDNLGQTFQDLSSGLSIGQFYRIDISEETGMISGGLQDNGGYILNGDEWKCYLGADGMETVIDPQNTDHVYGMIQHGGLFMSTTGGDNVISLGTPSVDGRWITPMVIDPQGDRIIAGYDHLFEYDFQNGWNQLSTFEFPELLKLISISESNANHIVVSTSNRIYRTTDNGANWTEITSNFIGNISSIETHPSNSEVIWITKSGRISGEKVYRTSNAGQNWENISSGLSSTPVNVVKFDEVNDGIYIGTDNGVLYASTLNNEWIEFDHNLPNVIVRDIEINQSQGLIQIGTFGRGVWQSELYGTEVMSRDVKVESIVSPSGTLCGTASDIVFDVKNNGLNSIFELEIQYTIGDQPANIYVWQGQMNTGETVHVTIPNVSFSSSDTDFQIDIVNLNGAPDENPTDNIVEQNLSVDTENNAVFLSLLTDCFPSETAWRIIDEDENIVATTMEALEAKKDYMFNLCLPDGCYELIITDSYGDGLNGSAGNCNADGNFSLLTNESLLYELDQPNFGETFSFPFCLGLESGLSWQNLPGDVTLSCDENTNPDETGAPEYTTECNPLEVSLTYQDEISDALISRTWKASNTCGHEIEYVQNITLEDEQPPEIICDVDQTLYTSLGSAYVNIEAPSISDNCGLAGFTNNFNFSTNASGEYPLGENMVMWTAFDLQGNQGNCVQTISVLDDVINGVSSASMEQTNGSIEVYPNPYFEGQLNIVFHVNEISNTLADVRLYDMTGRQVLLEKNIKVDGNQLISLDIDNLFNSGIYLLQVNKGSFSATRTLIIDN